LYANPAAAASTKEKFYHVDSSNVKDDTITYSIEEKDYHLTVLQDGAYEMTYRYKNPVVYWGSPYYVDAHCFTLSSYDADSGEFTVVVTDSAGQEIEAVYTVEFSHDDSLIGYKW